jgi:hypothetical protein
VTPGVSHPPLKKSCPYITKEERFLGKQGTVVEPLIWSEQHDSRLDHFLNSRVGNMPTIGRELEYGNELLCGVNVKECTWLE